MAFIPSTIVHTSSRNYSFNRCSLAPLSHSIKFRASRAFIPRQSRLHKDTTFKPDQQTNSTDTICALQAPAPARRTVLTLISTIVGVCVLIGSLLYKVPQVVRVIRRQSAAGISLLMYALETIGTTFSAVYFVRRAFPFSTYGETVFIMTQNFVIMVLIVFYERLPRAAAIACAVLYLMALCFLFSPFVPMKAIMSLQICSIPILNLARVPQIILNWRRKGTGELSPITLGLQLLGNVARIFTTVAQVRDLLMFVGICVATCFNATLFGQWLYYSKRVPPVSKQIAN